MNYYELLGIKETASVDEIKAAYKKQMKKWHPDINKSSQATNMSIKLNEAKNILLDCDKKKAYDEKLALERQENYDYHFNKTEKKTRNDEFYVSKWDYFKDWLKYGDSSILRKIIGTVGVVLESLFCKIISLCLYLISFLCFLITNFVQVILSLFSSIFLSLIFLFLFAILTKGISISTIITIFLVFIIVLILIIIVYLLPSLLLSPTVFDFLYNKLDITLFKKCVGYKD